MSVVTELITMKINERLEKKKFIEIVNTLENNFHSKQIGFLDTELLFDSKTNTWTMIQHWESLENLVTASNKLLKTTKAKDFISSLLPESIVKSVYTQIQKW